MATRVTVEHMRDAIALPWRYCVEDDRGRECWAGQCQTREQAYACVRAYLCALLNRRELDFAKLTESERITLERVTRADPLRHVRLSWLRGSQPQTP